MMKFFNLLTLCLFIINAACGIWAAKVLYKTIDIQKTILTMMYGISCFLLAVYLMIDIDDYYYWPMVPLLISSLLLLNIDRMRGEQ